MAHDDFIRFQGLVIFIIWNDSFVCVRVTYVCVWVLFSSFKAKNKSKRSLFSSLWINQKVLIPKGWPWPIEIICCFGSLLLIINYSNGIYVYMCRCNKAIIVWNRKISTLHACCVFLFCLSECFSRDLCWSKSFWIINEWFFFYNKI